MKSSDCKYKIIIQFDGTRYSGWQIQNLPILTVQREINNALEMIFKKAIRTTGSGRTDAGVHAKEFHIVFIAPFVIEHKKLVRALNANLPNDIMVLDSSFVDMQFNVTKDALSKEYRYFFSTADMGKPFAKKLMTHVKYDLDLESMKEACSLFLGTHDFKNFHCMGSAPNSTTRTITACEIYHIRNDDLSPIILGLVPDYYFLKIVGNGFLKQMVRLIMGSIWDVGRGRLENKDIINALGNSHFYHIAAVAPPEGLYKYNVQYPPDAFINSF